MNRGFCKDVFGKLVPNSPARMQDARLFTDYRANDVLNQRNPGMTSEEYRQYLMHKGVDIMRINDLTIFEKAGCSDSAHLPADKKYQYYLPSRK